MAPLLDVPGPVKDAPPATPGELPGTLAPPPLTPALPRVPRPVAGVPTPALLGAPALVTVMPAPPLVGPLDMPVWPMSSGLKKVGPDPVRSRGAPVAGSMQWVSGDTFAVTPVPVDPGDCADAPIMLLVMNTAVSNRVFIFIILASMTLLEWLTAVRTAEPRTV